MLLRELELRRIALNLVTPFRTSFGVEEHRDLLLLRVGTDRSDGWGECVAMQAPVSSSEFVDGSQLVIRDHFWPILTGSDIRAAEISQRLSAFAGHPMAKAALEAAVLDAELRSEGKNLHDLFGGGRDRVPSGVSVGIFDTVDELLEQVQQYVDDGYVRIKLKIEPGWDIEPVRLVRELIGPDMGLQVDANTAYGRTDIEHLRRLDEFDLLLIEQPLPEEDLLGHARLAEAAETPVCLDESIV